MPDETVVFAGSIPDLYDAYLVPLNFLPYAQDMARRVAGLAPAAVLETAAGSGVVPRALAPLLPKSARYVVTDLSQPMLDRAIRLQPADDRITWQQADALALPFDDASFDVVFCQFGVMFFPDRVAGYREARRVLKPGGTFLFNAWDRISENEFADTVSQTVAAYFPDDPPSFMADIPHGYNDTVRIAEDVKAAGFASAEVHTISDQSRADLPRSVAMAFCQGTPMRMEIEKRNPDALAEVTDLAEQAIARRFGNGPVTGRIRAHVAVART